MGCGVIGSRNAVSAFGNNLSVFYDNGTKRAAIIIYIGTREFDGAAHKVCMHSIPLPEKQKHGRSNVDNSIVDSFIVADCF
jgi:hypothetical protein